MYELMEDKGTISNEVCGDITEIYLRIHNGMIEDAKFKSYGCAVSPHMRGKGIRP
jgi:NifU-like protein involved in Fe-S cluster formation